MAKSGPESLFDVQPTEQGAGHTRLESVEEIRRSARAERTPTAAERTPTAAERTPTAKEQGPEADTLPFRPIRRPPMAMLCILDDGREDGEWLRIRRDKVVIGRSEGDVVIPEDSMMSGRHAEIVRQPHKGAHRWYLVDLGSTNGTYVRAADSVLRHGQEFLLGSRRFRFSSAPQGGETHVTAAAEARPETPKGGTRGWQTVAPSDLLPSVVELTPQGEGQRFLLTKQENWIGRDAALCTVAIPDELMISPRHARLHRDAKGHWHLENAGSRNGTWVRIQKLPLDGSSQFQLGEQRFLMRILQ